MEVNLEVCKETLNAYTIKILKTVSDKLLCLVLAISSSDICMITG